MRNLFPKQLTTEEVFDSINRLIDTEVVESAALRIVFTKSDSSDWSFFIGKVELGKEVDDFQAIYPNLACVRKKLKRRNLRSLAQGINEVGLEFLNRDNLVIDSSKSNQPSWSQDIIPSNATDGVYPSREFSVNFRNNHNFTDSELVGFKLPYYASSAVFIQNFMGLRTFHGSSDSRVGQFSIEAPDQRAYISIRDNTLAIIGEEAEICLVGSSPSAESILMAKSETLPFNEEELMESELWLITKENETLDFRSQKSFEYRVVSNSSELDQSKDLIEIIQNGEGPTLEFKSYIQLNISDNKKSKDLEKTVCAFSNARGGSLLVGVDDDGRPVGINKKVREHYRKETTEATQLYINGIKKYLREKLAFNDCFNVTSIQIGSEIVIKIDVQRSYKPNYIVNTEEAYIRKGATSAKMKPMETRENEDSNDPISILSGTRKNKA